MALSEKLLVPLGSVEAAIASLASLPDRIADLTVLEEARPAMNMLSVAPATMRRLEERGCFVLREDLTLPSRQD